MEPHEYPLYPHCRSSSCNINKEISLYKYVDITSFSFMELLYGTHMGPIWATRIWANPYGTDMEPGCTPHMGPIWVAHMEPI